MRAYDLLAEAIWFQAPIFESRKERFEKVKELDEL